MILPIVAYGSPVLRSKCENISNKYPELDSLLSDMWDTMYEASGVGLAALPDYIAHNIGGITKVLPNEPGKPTETHFVYPASLKNNARLIAFRNFLFSKVNEWKF